MPPTIRSNCLDKTAVNEIGLKSLHMYTTRSILRTAILRTNLEIWSILQTRHFTTIFILINSILVSYHFGCIKIIYLILGLKSWPSVHDSGPGDSGPCTLKVFVHNLS